MNWKDFKTLFYTILGTHYQDPETIDIGVGYARDIEDTFEILKKWTQNVDEQLETEDDDELQLRLWDVRLFSYEEFIDIFNHSPREDFEISAFKIFEFLLIRDKEAHEFFIQHYTADEEGYIKLMVEFNQIPVASFFFRPLRIPVRIKDFQQNTYITGMTGVGKSELLKNLFYQLIKKQKGSLVLIDPHGDLAEEILKLQIVGEQKDRIIYIDPYLDRNKIATLNPFETHDKSEDNIDLLTQELVNVFKELIPSALSLQMEAILTPCIAVLLRSNTGSLSELQRFMDDKHNLDLIEKGLQSPNPSHQTFFKNAFQKTDYRITKQSVYTRIQSLLNHKIFHDLINGKSTFSLRKAINSEKVIFFNLAQGKMGTEISSIYGKFIIAQLTSAALKRAYQPKEFRTPTYLFIDEFHNYLTISIEKILAETRKYGLHLIAANQNLAQIDNKKLKEIMLGNTHIKFVGRNSPLTLSVFAREMEVKLEKLQKLEQYTFFSKVGSNKAFSIKTTNHLTHRSYQLRDFEKENLKNYLFRHYKDKVEETNPITRTIIIENEQEENRQKADSEEQNVVIPIETKKEPIPKNSPKPKFGFTQNKEENE
ncbi:type IV secretory system conjugative DNA transfer family protein [Bernardetia sp. OM2101]|uniref:type IV secretory system conjugative DNA transfer family protein n=1 Tax=Bernardetia sp. OM2101 TaxID=3344876 RepID=UPI0035CFB575